MVYAAKTCDSKCFCPCRIPGGGSSDVIVPNDECFTVIRCKFFESECSPEIIACARDLCFCPCRRPEGGPLCKPSETCLETIRCEFGKSECTTRYLAACGF